MQTLTKHWIHLDISLYRLGIGGKLKENEPVRLSCDSYRISLCLNRVFKTFSSPMARVATPFSILDFCIFSRSCSLFAQYDPANACTASAWIFNKYVSSLWLIIFTVNRTRLVLQSCSHLHPFSLPFPFLLPSTPVLFYTPSCNRI